MASTVDYAFSHNVQRINVQTFTKYRSPVYNNAAYDIVLEHYVFNGITVEDCCSGMHSLIKQCRRTLNRVHYIESVAVRLIIDVEILYDVNGFFLHDNLVEHHGTAPHTAAGSKLTVELRYFQSGLGEIIRSNNA